MENELQRLFDKVQDLQNVYGFSARHFIKTEQAKRSYLNYLYENIRDGKIQLESTLDERIVNFGNSYFNKQQEE